MAVRKKSGGAGRWLLVLVMVAAGCAAYFYLVTPSQTVEKLVSAAQDGNDAAFAEGIDIESFRASLQAQAVIDPQSAERGTLAALGQDVVDSVSEPLINAVVTPRTVALLVAQLDDAEETNGPPWTITLEGPSSFAVRKGGPGSASWLAFRFRREGLSWVLAEQILREDAASSAP